LPKAYFDTDSTSNSLFKPIRIRKGQELKLSWNTGSALLMEIDSRDIERKTT
jgi:hypothetical protein